MTTGRINRVAVLKRLLRLLLSDQTQVPSHLTASLCLHIEKHKTTSYTPQVELH